MSKTPYELREEVLELARSHVMDEYSSELQEWQAYADAARNYGQSVPADHLAKFPKFPPVSKVLKVAEQFRAFVDNNFVEKPITSSREDFNGLVETIKEAMPIKIVAPKDTEGLLTPDMNKVMRGNLDNHAGIPIYEANHQEAYAGRTDLAAFELLVLESEVNAGIITYEQACDPNTYPDESKVFTRNGVYPTVGKPVEVVVKKRRRTTKAK